MVTRGLRLLSCAAVAAFLGSLASVSLAQQDPAPGDNPSLVYHIVGTKPRLNRRVMGQARRWVQGVPAEPVDSMVWNGEGSTEIEGRIELEIDPVRNTGYIVARWTDENGRWFLRQTRFTHPDEHPSGVRIGSSVYGVDTIINEPIVQNVYLHGDTTAGAAVLPTVFTYLAAWGRLDVFLDGAYFASPFDPPAPCWEGHLMVTEGVRYPDGTVRTIWGGFYNPTLMAEGVVEEGDLEVHMTFHDDQFPVTTNIPPLFSFFYHLVFEDVQMEIGPAAPRPELALEGGTRRSTVRGRIDSPFIRDLAVEPGVCSEPIQRD